MPGETETLLGQTETPSPDLGLENAELPPPGQEQAEAQPASEEGQPSAEQEEAEAPTLEDFQSFLQEHDEERDHELRTELGRKQSRVARSFEQSLDRVDKANQALNFHFPALQQALQSGDENQARMVAAQLNPALATLGTEFLQNEKRLSAKGVLDGVISELGADSAQLEDYVWDVLEARDDESHATAIKTLVSRLVRERDKKARADAVAEWEAKSMARRDKETKAGERARQAPPARTGGGAGTGVVTPRTKSEAAALHVQDKISNAEMRRIRNDPSIPE